MRKIARMPTSTPMTPAGGIEEGGESPRALSAAAGGRLRHALGEMLAIESDPDTRVLVAAARRAVDRDVLRLTTASDAEATEMGEILRERLRILNAARSASRQRPPAPGA